MSTIILFIFGLMKGISLVKKEYKWYHNVNIFLRSFKTWFIFELMIWGTMIYTVILYNISQLLGDKMLEPIKLFGTVGHAFSFYGIIFIIMMYIYGIMKILEPDSRIEEIQIMYDLEMEEIEKWI